jgi:hypothetical protein
VKNDDGNIPLHLAARWGYLGRTEVLSLLVECWPQGKEALDKAELTPLEMFEKHVPKFVADN